MKVEYNILVTYPYHIISYKTVLGIIWYIVSVNVGPKQCLYPHLHT